MKPTIIPISSPFPKVDTRPPFEEVLAERLLKIFSKTQTTCVALTLTNLYCWITPMFSVKEIEFSLYKLGFHERRIQHSSSTFVIDYNDDVLEIEPLTTNKFYAYQFFLTDIKQ